MKKLLFLLSILFSTSVFSLSEEEILQNERLEWAKDYFSKKGGPIPDGGIKILPEKEMSTYEESKKIRKKMKDDIQKFGYINQNNDPNNRLFHLKEYALHDLTSHAQNSRPTNTHLKSTIDELKMAYEFKGIPINEITESIGFAPYGTYIKDKGWIGAHHFFIKDEIGNCVFIENNIKLSHGAIIIPKEDVTYLIHNKPTTTYISGNTKSGFLYHIDWYDLNFFRSIECANKKYNEEIMQKIIELATKIDLN